VLKIKLKVGLKTRSDGEDEVVHKDAEIRPLTVGEIIQSGVDGEKLVQTPAGDYQLIQSPTLTGIHSLRFGIVKIGDIPGPLSMEMMFKLDPLDMELLQNESIKLQAATLEVSQSRGKRNTGKSG